MQANQYLTEGLALLGRIAPISTQGTQGTTIIDTREMRRVVFVVNVGTVGSSGTIDFSVATAATQNGTKTVIPADAAKVTQITATGIAQVEIRAESLGAAGLGPWIQGTLVTGTAASIAGVTVHGALGRFKPESNYNLSTAAAPVVY